MKKVRSIVLCTLLLVTLIAGTVSATAATEPTELESCTTVYYENDFENVTANDSQLPSGSETTAKDNAATNTRHSNCSYQILEESVEGNTNKYLKFIPTSTSSNGYTAGNIIDSGYFSTKAIKNISNNQTASAAPIEIYPAIDKVRIDFSIRFDKLMDSEVSVANGAISSLYPLIYFEADGDYKIAAGTATKSYSANTWINFSVYLDFVKNDCILYEGTEKIGNAAISGFGRTYFNNLRFIANSQGKTQDEIKEMGISIDNIKYSTSYSEDFVNRKDVLSGGYTQNLANEDFEENINTSSEKYFVKYESSNSANHVFPYVVNNPTNSSEKVANATILTAFGINTSNIMHTPSLVKASMEVYKTHDGSVNIYINEDYEVVRYTKSGGITFNMNGKEDNSGRVNDTTTADIKNKWVKVTLYFDFNAGKYYAFLDDIFKGEYPVTEKSLSKFYVQSQNTGGIYVDNINIDTLPAFNEAVISEYKTAMGIEKMSFVAKNSTGDVKSYKIIRAKYNANHSLAEAEIMEDGSIAANATELENLEYPTIGKDGSYYKYFIWDSISNLVPMVESITLN